ncbi:hypothetical protein SAMN04488503_3223 [Humidesulfovibrio mexicanus]|uniref:Uncharacterized protein n=1 Tax=Humidesulfovibrio mexicanus TaxID=147047 RepID=A0A239CQ28_9BACT|nr:hypothetical protein [Humidesulfovibrio mexicanus]SNS21503.1 hypothetical protein SAMN04488503_3223 [Humidesulfovibrio mexicanus]
MTYAHHQAFIAVSGQDCPHTGVWRALDSSVPPLLVRKGEIMPGAAGRVVSWELVQPGEATMASAIPD